MVTKAKRRRRRCANPKCEKHFRHSRDTRKTCSDACKMAVYRQRKAAVVALVQVLAAAAAKVKRQDAKAEADARIKRIIDELADRKRTADAEERARVRETPEQQEAEPSEPAPTRKGYGGYGGFSPASEPITVELGRVPTFGEVATRLPPGQRSPWRR